MKKVVSKKNTNGIDVAELTPDMIIIWSSVELYKLHRIDFDPVKFAFIELSNSECWANGSFGSFKRAIESVKDKDIYVLDDIREISEIPMD